MYILDKIKQNIVKEINKALGNKMIQASDLIFPPNSEFGDLSLPCFKLVKKIKESIGETKSLRFSSKNRRDLVSTPSFIDSLKTPVEAASWLVSKTEFSKTELNSVVSSVKAIGPYLNFTLNKNYLAKNVIKEIEKQEGRYGENEGGKGKKIMIEYSNANTHKEYHVGHLRNICYGDAVNRILSANGYKSIPVSYINDFGIHVAKTLWAYEVFFRDKKLPENKGYFLGQVYVKATRELEKNEAAKRLVAMMMKKIEERVGAEYKLWQKTRKWSIEQFDKIYKELGVKFEHIFYESEVIKKGMELVLKLYKRGILTKSDGAIIADLTKYNLGVLVFLRSDGTALYPVADLPLAEEKFKKYKPDKSIYVVDIRQSQYFKQLFKVLELMGHKERMVHLGYEFVKLPTGMMSSRTGNVITYEDLRAEAMKKAARETRKRHKDWSERKIAEVAGKIVNGAIKFEMIKVGASQVITFDIDKALRFEGYTAAYLQYTYARIQSIVRKSKVESRKSKIDFNNLKEEKEYSLIMKLAKYPDIVSRAGENYDPSEIAKYLFELARDFNDYYHSVPILKANEEIRAARLVLINAVALVIKNGLGLLGIEIIQEM
jgi:arginyl-tRNA synthetase